MNRVPANRPSDDSLLEIERGSGPFIATSVHSGHAIRASLFPRIVVSDDERLREEDPLTELWATVCPNRIVFRRSRFEIDLNRPPTHSVYLKPEEAWGMQIWNEAPDDNTIRKGMRLYRACYARILEHLEDLERRHGKFVVLDIHSYNHRRAGAGQPPADPELNPEINVGTGSMDRCRWGNVVDRFIKDLTAFDFLGRSLDVRENVRFSGGYLARWVHEQFPTSGCALAIEIKKFYMDEWTGEVDPVAVATIQAALASTLNGLGEELAR
jgi:N-formylglutamate amidohydrolase